MRLWTILRSSPAAWLSVPLVLLAVLYVRTYILRWMVDPYATGLSSQAATTLGLIAPICAGLGAWEAGRIRRSRAWAAPLVRRKGVAIAWLVGPPIVVGVAAVVAGMLAVLVANGLLLPDPRPVLVVTAVITAHTLAGFALGTWLATVVAVPTAIIVSFTWQVMVRVLDPLWTHLLTGQALERCCGASDDIAPEAIWAPVAAAAGIAVAARLAITARSVPGAVAMAAVPLLIGLVAASAIAQGRPDGASHVDRSEAALVCSDGATGPRVCIWPEHEPRLPEAVMLAEQATSAWQRFGLEVPSELTESMRVDESRDTLRFVLSSAASSDDVIGGLAYEMVPPWIECTGLPAAQLAPDYLEAWYAAAAGMSPSGLEARFSGVSFGTFPDILELVSAVRALPVRQQRAWVEHNDWAARACDREPDLDPRP